MNLNFLDASLNPKDNFSSHLCDSMLSVKGKELFCSFIYEYYHTKGRQFVWRETSDPYFIVVSEIMLQQTQTDRVKDKFQAFIDRFPTLADLAQSSTRDVIVQWKGLGYNRRALALQAFAQRVVSEFNGVIPSDPDVLKTFKGIGSATAASIVTFAFNKPTVFIETNIRSVFIHCFFHDKKEVKDSDIIPLIRQTLDQQHPRLWYYALMDYGAMLKKIYKNPSRQSAHYIKQSKFEGSDRQIRGQILQLLIDYSALSLLQIEKYLKKDSQKIISLVSDLEREGFILKNDDYYSLW